MEYKKQYLQKGDRVKATTGFGVVKAGTTGTVEEIDHSGHHLSHRIRWDVFVGIIHEINTEDSNGRSTWARRQDIEELPREVFKAGEYIVALNGIDAGTSGLKKNHVYRQLKDSRYLCPEKDSNGRSHMNWAFIDARLSSTYTMASQEQIDAYNACGGPVSADSVKPASRPTLYNPITFELMEDNWNEAFDSAEENIFIESSSNYDIESEIEKLSRVEKFIF